MEPLASNIRDWLAAVLLGGIVILVVVALGVPAATEPELPSEEGLASFYGPGFQGEETASGEIFDQNQMTAAHRKLPLGSVVRVTNLENGRQVIVRVTDRGPYGRNYRRGAIIDVSKGAARRLDFIEDGLVRVRVDVLETPERDEPGEGQEQARRG
jgi:rare lipoprotein A